jgi:hypothetical protein
MKTLLAAAVAAAALYAASANAMTYSYRMAGRQIVVNATGEIMPNETELMTQWTVTLPVAIQHTPIAAFVFNSTGGNVLEAKRLAVAIRNGDERPNTGVAAGGMCASACVLLWAAGAHKSVAADSRVGVHMTSLGDDASQTSLLLNGMIGRDLASVGAPASVVAAAVATPGDSIYWLTPADFTAWNVNIVDSTPTPVATASAFRQAPGVGPVIDDPHSPTAPSWGSLLSAKFPRATTTVTRRQPH